MSKRSVRQIKWMIYSGRIEQLVRIREQRSLIWTLLKILEAKAR